MPAAYKMSWEPKARRWWKQYKGRRYQVSCRQLNAPENKEASYQAANAWWISKKAEIDGHQPPHEFADWLADLSRRRDWATRHDRSEIASALSLEIARIKLGGTPGYMPDDTPHPYRADEPALPLPRFDSEEEASLVLALRDKERAEIDQAFDPLDKNWNDRLAWDDSEPIPSDQRMASLVKEWLRLKQAKVEAGVRSAKGYDNTVDCVNHFRDWLGPEAAVAVIDAKRWESYWLHLNGKIKEKVWSRDYVGKVFRTARSFVEWLSKRDLIPLPKNLHDRELRFGSATKAVPRMTVDEVRMLVKEATGQLRLHLLLMANCGMTQKDIADLLQTEVDWREGRIIRKRSKTGDRDTVPTVNYKLWPLTWELLQVHRAAGGERALLTLSGHPWVDSRLVDGKLESTDNIASNYVHLKRKLNFKKPLKLLRKTSASLLDESTDFGRYVGHFLGHAPRSVRDRHYVLPSQDMFDAAVAWLGSQYGFVADEET